jgi:hypothetical protein
MLSLSGANRKLESRIYSEAYMLRLLLLLLIAAVALKLSVDMSGLAQLDYAGFGCHSSAVWGWLGVDAFEIVLLLFAIWKLRSIRDDYGISTELTSVCVIWVVCSIGLALSIFLRRSNTPSHWFGGDGLSFEAYVEFQAALWAVRNLAIFFTSCSWPLIQSYYNSFPPLWSNWYEGGECGYQTTPVGDAEERQRRLTSTCVSVCVSVLLCCLLLLSLSLSVCVCVCVCVTVVVV